MISLRVSLLPSSSRAVLRPNSLPLQPLPRRLRHQGRYKQRARCVPFCQTNSVIMQSISITSLCLCMCSIAGELNLSSVMVLRKGVCSVFKPLKLRLAVHVHTGQGKKVMRATLYSGIELQLAWSKVSTKVCGFTFGSISLHLISKRIKEILTQKHQCNAKYLSQFNYKTAFRKLKKIYICFPNFSCMHGHMCVQACYIRGNRNS